MTRVIYRGYTERREAKDSKNFRLTSSVLMLGLGVCQELPRLFLSEPSSRLETHLSTVSGVSSLHYVPVSCGIK